MEDADRIRALRDQGRIDDAQADRLLAALGALAPGSPAPAAHDERPTDEDARNGEPAEHAPEATRPTADASDADANAGPPTTRSPLPTGAGATPAMASATTPSTDASAVPGAPGDAGAPAGSAAAGAPGARHRDDAHGSDAAEGGPAGPRAASGPARTGETPAGDASAQDAHGAVVRRWVRVEMLAGELAVRSDPSLDAPVVDGSEGDVEISVDGDGWRVTQRSGRDGSNWVERLVDGLKRSKVRLRVPADAGLDVDLKAGDVELEGVPALRGRLLAGDLEAVGLRAVDVTVQAGDLDLALAPAPGSHRVRMTAGDAEIRLPRDADVTIRGRVSVGDVSAPEPLRTNRRNVSDRVEGTLGDGRATLSIEMVTGDLDIRVG